MPVRRVRPLIIALLSALTASLMLTGVGQSLKPASSRTSAQTCGEAEKFGHTFGVRTKGRRTSCKAAMDVIDAPCKVHLKRQWSCFSFRGSYPFIVWFPSKEILDRRWSRVIVYRRYPCSEAVVTRELFAREPRGFPSLRQLLADDIIRCDLFDGQTYSQVRRLLGPPVYGKKGRYLSYDIGLERDSFFQVDPELLSVGFDKRGTYASATINQG
jgi:hypothetical protein